MSAGASARRRRSHGGKHTTMSPRVCCPYDYCTCSFSCVRALKRCGCWRRFRMPLRMPLRLPLRNYAIDMIYNLKHYSRHIMRYELVSIPITTNLRSYLRNSK